MKIISNLIHPKYDTPDTNTTTPKKKTLLRGELFLHFSAFRSLSIMMRREGRLYLELEQRSCAKHPFI